MFNLNTSIRGVAPHARAYPALVGDDLEELEQHLRDQIEALKAEDLTEKEAFQRALELMGDYSSAEEEYGNVEAGPSDCGIAASRELIDCGCVGSSLHAIISLQAQHESGSFR